MTNDLVIVENTGEKSIIPVEEIKKYFAPNASDAELWAFMGMAKAYNLNPFKREVHFAKFGSGEQARAQIMVGYEVYIKRAERTGKLEWWDVKIEGTGMNMKGVFTAKRRDWSEPFRWEAEREEFDKGQKEGSKPNNPWKVMPKFMLKKCAISQGMRLLLPEDLGGMPYTPEEIVAQVADTVIDADYEDIPEEQQITPEEDEKKKALEPLLTKINGFATLAQLEEWVKKQEKNIHKSLAKAEIESAIAAKRESFQPKPANGITEEDMTKFELEVWAEKMNECQSLADLMDWYAVNQEAISNSQVNQQVLEYLQKRQNELKQAPGPDPKQEAISPRPDETF